LQPDKSAGADNLYPILIRNCTAAVAERLSGLWPIIGWICFWTFLVDWYNVGAWKMSREQRHNLFHQSESYPMRIYWTYLEWPHCINEESEVISSWHNNKILTGKVNVANDNFFSLHTGSHNTRSHSLNLNYCQFSALDSIYEKTFSVSESSKFGTVCHKMLSTPHLSRCSRENWTSTPWNGYKR